MMEGLRDATYASAAGPRDSSMTWMSSPRSRAAASLPLITRCFGRPSSTLSRHVLHQDIQGALLARTLWPPNWFRLGRVGWDRINLAAELYDETVFDHKTFDDLLRDKRKPYIVLMPPI